VTLETVQTYQEAKNAKKNWVQRLTDANIMQTTSDELHQAVMVHTKSVSVEVANNWAEQCRHDYKKKWKGCWIGFPWPNGTASANETYNSEGLEYNCFVNPAVENIWIPKLKKALASRAEFVRSNT